MKTLVMLIWIVAAAACGTAQTTRNHGEDAPISPVVGSLPPAEQDWCYRWHAVQSAKDEQALQKQVILARAYALDMNLAMRVSNVFMYSDVREKVRQATSTLLGRNPGDVDALVARGLWSLIFDKQFLAAVGDLCQAATLVTNRGDLQEYCADALNAVDRREEGSRHLVAAYQLYDDRNNQCRVVRKIESTAPRLDQTMSQVSPLVQDYCKREQQAINQYEHAERQRRQNAQQCLATCQAGHINCKGWQCGNNLNACITACND